jgi:hypothetical protein
MVFHRGYPENLTDTAEFKRVSTSIKISKKRILPTAGVSSRVDLTSLGAVSFVAMVAAMSDSFFLRISRASGLIINDCQRRDDHENGTHGINLWIRRFQKDLMSQRVRCFLSGTETKCSVRFWLARLFQLTHFRGIDHLFATPLMHALLGIGVKVSYDSWRAVCGELGRNKRL